MHNKMVRPHAFHRHRSSVEPLADGSMPKAQPSPPTDVIDRIVTIIGDLNVTDEERAVWNREVGRVVSMARGGKADAVREMLTGMSAKLNDCFLTALQSDLQVTRESIVEAISHGYTLDELYEVHDAVGRPLQARTAELAELRGIVEAMRAQALPQINRAGTQASAALNAEKLRQSEKGRATRESEQLLMLHAASFPQFLDRLNVSVMREQLRRSPAVLALAMRRFGALSVHFLGHDQARVENREHLAGLLGAGSADGVIGAMSLHEVTTVLESLRQLVGEAGCTLPEAARFIDDLVARCMELFAESDNPQLSLKALNTLSRLQLNHPKVPELRRLLLANVAESSAGLLSHEVALAIESWRRAYQEPSVTDDDAVCMLMQRGAQVVPAYDHRRVIGALHDVAELGSVRNSPHARSYVQSLMAQGTELAGKFGPQDVAHGMRSVGLMVGDGIDESFFTEAVAQRGAALLSDHRQRGAFGNREVGMSLHALADIERNRAQRRVLPIPSQARGQFIDGLAGRSAELADRHDAVSGASSFVAFAHIDYRSPAVWHLLQTLARTGPKWATAGSPPDCERRQSESLWSIARMGLADEHSVEFARFLSRTLTQRLPQMNLTTLARNLWSCMVVQQMTPGALAGDELKPLMDRADELAAGHCGKLQFPEAMQLYHGLTGLRGHGNPDCTAVCAGDAASWVQTGALPANFRRHSETQSGYQGVSDAESDVRDHLLRRFGSDAQPDVLHHGYGLDIALRIERPGCEPFLVDIEVDGPTHQSSRYRHTDAIRDRMLEQHFSTRVVRLRYCNSRRELLAEVDEAVERLHHLPLDVITSPALKNPQDATSGGFQGLQY